ncbi:zinc finger protein VAR3, chloroplastic-like [Quillaja saponaria]|uniref:Zinc finger protein VAR3, chloroplastic-like n=1 Tax=Quillaja saponaria TaxID=32244 RepID=A0AAD7LAR8_QUISA|nr:zinc finger protein VAR3, chloroplastic-like [Quillaja saponaria]
MIKLFCSSFIRRFQHLQSSTNFTPISLFHCLTKTLAPRTMLELVLDDVEELQSSKLTNEISQSVSETEDPYKRGVYAKAEKSTFRISHPWPEWVNLMECLLKRGYFDGEGNPFQNGEMGTKESNLIRTACLNFGRDRYNLIRFLSRQDIQVVAGCGCPSLDRKVVNSGKRLRAHVGIDEGNVCSSCNLRGDCERAFVKAREDEGGRTVDVMRIMLTYGLDPITSTVENKPCLNKIVKESLRRLLKEVVQYSIKVDSSIPNTTALETVPSAQVDLYQENSPKSIPMKLGDWLCPKCNFLNFAGNRKCLCCDGLFPERLRQSHENGDLPLKKGDWICHKCNFLNFAKNTRCLQCKEKPPKRKLNPGEWECDSCNYINFRRNIVCLKCDHRRPKASNAPEYSFHPQHKDKGYHKNSKLDFSSGGADLHDQQSVYKYRRNRNRDEDMWRFVEDVSENCSKSLNDTLRIANFPINGCNTDLSKNAQKRNRKVKGGDVIKEEMHPSGKRIDEELLFADTETTSELSDSTDDDLMTKWFGNGKKE